MRIVILLIIYLQATYCVFAQGVGIAPGSSGVGVKPHTNDIVYNVVDYGAKCNGVTDDTAAINLTFSTAANSVGYLNNYPIKIVGPVGPNNKGCNITSLNATIFTRGNANNLGPVVEIELALNCSGAGNTCIDFTGSSLVHLTELNIYGSSSSPPGS